MGGDEADLPATDEETNGQQHESAMRSRLLERLAKGLFQAFPGPVVGLPGQRGGERHHQRRHHRQKQQRRRPAIGGYEKLTQRDDHQLAR